MTIQQIARRAAGERVSTRVEGVYRGWWVAVAISLAGLSQAAFVNPVLGVFMTPLHDEFGWSRGMVAGGLSVGTFAGALISPVVGPMLDRHGGRLFMAGAAIAMTVCLLLLSMMQSAWQYYALYGFGRAMTIGVVSMASTVTIANWFIRDRGRATAVMLLGGRGGMALGPLFTLAVVAIWGWRSAFVSLAVICFVLGFIPALLLIRRRPEDVGLVPDGAARAALARAGNKPAVLDPHWTAREATRTKAFWLLLFGTSQIFVVSGAINLSMIPHFEDQGLGRGAAVGVVTVWALVGILGGMAGSEMVQRFSVRGPLAITMALTALGIFWLIFVDNIWGAYLFAIGHGLSFGAQQPMAQIAYSEYFGRWSLGSISGVTQPVQWVLGGGGPVIASIAFDMLGSYTAIFGAYVLLSLFGGVLIFFAKPPVRPAPAIIPALAKGD